MIAHCVQWQCSGLRLHHSQYRMSVQPDTGNVLDLCCFFVNESCFWGCQLPWEKLHSGFWRHSLTSKEPLTHQVWQEAVNSSTQKLQGCFLTPGNLSWTPTLQFLSLLSSSFLSLPVFLPTSPPHFPPFPSSLLPPLPSFPLSQVYWSGPGDQCSGGERSTARQEPRHLPGPVWRKNLPASSTRRGHHEKVSVINYFNNLPSARNRNVWCCFVYLATSY